METANDKYVAIELMIESSIDAMIAIDTDQIITAWNNAATSLFARKREQAIGRKLTELLPDLAPDEALAHAIRWGADGKKSFLPADSHQAHRQHVEIHVIPLVTDNETTGIMLLIHDVSHRIAKEQELQQLNEKLNERIRQLHIATRESSQLTNIASNNIRKPIREVYVAVESLLHKEASVMSHAGRAAFRRIQSLLTRMSLLLDDVITLTQIDISESPDEHVNMAELVADLRASYGQRLSDMQATFTFGDLCTVRAHRNQVLLLLQQILGNVIRKGPGPRPVVHIECRKEYFAGEPGTNRQEGDYYVLSITHNSTAFGEVIADANSLDQSADAQTSMAPAIALIIANKILEVHSGFMITEKTINDATKMLCFFPVTAQRHRPSKQRSSTAAE